MYKNQFVQTFMNRKVGKQEFRIHQQGNFLIGSINFQYIEVKEQQISVFIDVWDVTFKYKEINRFFETPCMVGSVFGDFVLETILHMKYFPTYEFIISYSPNIDCDY
jgi:hypothetical protein